METQKCGTPRAKLAVPSMGSTTQVGAPSCGARPAPSSPMKPSPGNSACSRAGDQPLDLAVDLGEEVLRAFHADGEGAAIEEAAPGDLAGLARDGLRGVQAQAELRESKQGVLAVRNGCRSRARSAPARRRGRCTRAARARDDLADGAHRNAGGGGRGLETRSAVAAGTRPAPHSRRRRWRQSRKRRDRRRYRRGRQARAGPRAGRAAADAARAQHLGEIADEAVGDVHRRRGRRAQRRGEREARLRQQIAGEQVARDALARAPAPARAAGAGRARRRRWSR